MRNLIFYILFFSGFWSTTAKTCSIFYYVDHITCKRYVANNEDYYDGNKSYAQIETSSKNKLVLLWYGWDNFAQGGSNQAGLFYDVVVTPHQGQIKGQKKFNANIGDQVLSKLKTVSEALQFIDDIELLLPDTRILFGDATENDVVVKWIGRKKRATSIQNNRLIITDFLLLVPEKGGYPCTRYNTIDKT